MQGAGHLADQPVLFGRAPRWSLRKPTVQLEGAADAYLGPLGRRLCEHSFADLFESGQTPGVAALRC